MQHKESDKQVQMKPATTSETSRTVQRKAASVPASGYESQRAALSPVQMKGGGGGQDVASVAQSGLKGGGGSLPHLDTIQKSFGAHDVSSVQAYSGGAAQSASESLGASAYAMGNSVAFKSSPDLHTAAHEAAHVVQQRAGVSLPGGVGQAGDKYEQHADAVADRVVSGKSAGDLLSNVARPSAASGATGVQKLGERLDKPLSDGAAVPEHGTTEGEQRRYSVEQYIEMWEKEHGGAMTPEQKATLARGCIGITAVNLDAVNPPLDHAFATFEQAQAVVTRWNRFITKNADKTDPRSGRKYGEYKAFLFAKLFWSNQDPDAEKRKQPDDKAYKPDANTGKVDMSNYKYRAQPGYVNFDYGFWDEDSQCFWHANHAMPDMKVYQSTREKFAKGYIDFDRIIYCAAIGNNYQAARAATSR